MPWGREGSSRPAWMLRGSAALTAAPQRSLAMNPGRTSSPLGTESTLCPKTSNGFPLFNNYKIWILPMAFQVFCNEHAIYLLGLNFYYIPPRIKQHCFPNTHAFLPTESFLIQFLWPDCLPDLPSCVPSLPFVPGECLLETQANLSPLWSLPIPLSRLAPRMLTQCRACGVPSPVRLWVLWGQELPLLISIFLSQGWCHLDGIKCCWTTKETNKYGDSPSHQQADLLGLLTWIVQKGF